MKDPVRGHVTLNAVVVVVIGLVAGIGGACSPPRPVVDVRNPDPSGKIPAYKEAVREKDRRAARQMVRDLNSDDPAVRLYAFVGLRRLSGGETFGYQYFDDEDARRPAIQRWQRWLAGEDDKDVHGDARQEAAAVNDRGATPDAPSKASGP